MKFIVAFVLLFAAVAAQKSPADESRTKAMADMKHCITETGISREKAMQVRSGVAGSVDDESKCFVKCYFKKTGFMNDADEILKDTMIARLVAEGRSSQTSEDVINKCAQEKGTDSCDTAYKVFKCYRADIPLSRPTHSHRHEHSN